MDAWTRTQKTKPPGTQSSEDVMVGVLSDIQEIVNIARTIQSQMGEEDRRDAP
jgi:hypothetical protein